MKILKSIAIAFVLLAVFLSAAPVWAQTANTGAVLGTVVDAKGGVVPDSVVELTSTATNETKSTQTNGAGQYVFAAVTPGNYSLKVIKKGFRTVHITNITVNVTKSYTYDVTLEVSAGAEVVEVTADVKNELQTTDAQVGAVVGGQELQRLPTLQRDATELLALQPGSTPGGFDTGGTVSGARSDQNTLTLDGIDISDNLTGGQGLRFNILPTGVESISEFRVGVGNPNVTFGRSAGGQISLVTRSGTNSLHGSAYWLHQNDELNANEWTLNRLRQKQPELKDNRGGFSVGGPFWKDKTFFFGNYEVRRFPQSAIITRIVPTPSLRRGVLTFNDGTGAPVPYDLKTSTLCNDGNTPCDPRGIGISPSTSALWALMPPGNDNSVGDHLNTTGYTTTASAPIKDDIIHFRLDHYFTSKAHFFGRYGYARDVEADAANPGDLDIRGTTPKVLRTIGTRGDEAVGGLDYDFSSHLSNSFRFGWVRQRFDLLGTDATGAANLLSLAGTNTSAGFVGFAPTLSTFAGSFLDTPIDLETQNNRTQIGHAPNKQFVEGINWNKGTHTVSSGFSIRWLPFLFVHNDKVTTEAALVATADAAPGGNLAIPSADKPPVCTSTLTTNCLVATDSVRWDRLYAASLGLLDNIQVVGTRDGSLNPLPLGTPIIADTNMHYYEFYGQDTWRFRPSLTLTYGLLYSWQTPPSEKLGRFTLLTNNQNGQLLTDFGYLNAKKAAALAGQAFNPQLAFVPIQKSGRNNLYNNDLTDFAPRVSLAWSPNFRGGWLGHAFGDRKTVLRGGFAISYDRQNTVTVILPAGFGVGFSEVLTTVLPACNASGSPGANCNATTANNPGMSSFRVGVDGNIPVPQAGPAQSPIVPGLFPAGNFQTLSFTTDPDFKAGRNYAFDFTIQREIPWNLLLEVGYLGRLGRNLPTNLDFNASPYFLKDSASGQTFAQAFDNLACVLRGQAGQKIGTFQCPATVGPQAWFENQLFAGATNVMTSLFPTQFTQGDLNTLFLLMNAAFRAPAGQTTYNNQQVLLLLTRSHGGRSNYNAAFFSLHKRPSHGVQFDLSYTFSKSLDQGGVIQNDAGVAVDPYNLDIDYGPSFFDRTHTFNATFDYDLPLGKGHRLGSQYGAVNRIIGGWYAAGIFTAYSGLPLVVSQGGGVFGGSLAANNVGEIPLVDPSSLGTGVHSGGCAGPGNPGSDGDGPNCASLYPPGTVLSGSGISLFSNSPKAFNSFRPILLSLDGRTGRAHPVRGFPFWNLDLRLGKSTSITERYKVDFSADFFNIFNHVNFSDQTTSFLDTTTPASFGVVTSAVIPTNRISNAARFIQLGLRVSF